MYSRWSDSDFTASLDEKVWTASPVVRRYLHRLASGSDDCDWLTWIRAHHLPPRVDRILVIGCGSGWLERALIRKAGIGTITACDASADRVRSAEKVARENGLSGIDYRTVDLEKEALPDGSFDAVLAHDVLHHITDLEGLYGRIQAALAPGGRFLFNEYVGPNRFQYGDGQMELINRYFRLIPDHLRMNRYWRILPWSKPRPDPVQLAADDPTEAVRSEDVLPLARRFFEVEKEYPYGGGLLNYLLYETIANFDESRDYDNGLLHALCEAEDRLTRSGAIDPAFCIFVGRPRPSLT